MEQFHLNINPLLQGNFEIKKLNMAFVFQVNCPGCFIHGFPLVNHLYEKYKDRMAFIGISTAFEDFELNTEENTLKLLQNGSLVGETEKYYIDNYSQSIYSSAINFPVAFDCVSTKEVFLSEANILAICNLNPNFKIWPVWEQDEMAKRVKDHYANQKLIPETFTLNQLKGTPSFIMFDEEYFPLQILFGHQHSKNMEIMLEQYLAM